MSEDALHDFILQMFKTWEHSIYHHTNLEEKVLTLRNMKEEYIEFMEERPDAQ